MTKVSYPKFDYPNAKKSDHVDTYHGVDVADPYVWLEDPNSSDTKTWVEAQNELSRGFLNDIPERDAIKKRLAEVWNYEKLLTPFRRGEWYFQFRNSGLQNQFVLYKMDSLEDEGEIFLDPNSFSEDGTASLGAFSFSKDAQYMAYSKSVSGSDWKSWYVRDVASGTDLTDELHWSKFANVTWLPDSSGFLYRRYAQPSTDEAFTAANNSPQVCLHVLGTTQADDVVIFEKPEEPKLALSPVITDDGDYVIYIVTKGKGYRYAVYYQALKPSEEGFGLSSDFTELINEFENVYDFLGNDGTRFYFRTNYDAAKYHIIAIDINKPEKEHWQTIVPEKEDTLGSCTMLGDSFVCGYLHDAYGVLKRYNLQGEHIDSINLPGIGSITTFSAKREHTEAFFGFTSFTSPLSSYRYDVKSKEVKLLRSTTVSIDTSLYETKQVFSTSKDGTKVPMFITHKKGLDLDGQNPTLLYAYGGFNASLTPSFSMSRMVWMEMGGVLAVANLRGGGEYGKEWHEAGTVHQKQNVFDDFISCAEYLIESGYTSTPKLAVEGRSNGGLLIGACMTQRPDLFGACLPAVGVMDMLKFHQFTIGWAWVGDYGSSENEAEFKSIYAYSPLHNLKEGTAYPPTLVTTSDHDDRVVPAHSFKFAARLQEVHSGDNPVLISIETKAGHGMGKPTAMVIEEQADQWAFLVKTLNIEV